MSDQLDLIATVRTLSNPSLVMQRVADEALALIPAAEGAAVGLLGDDGRLRWGPARGSLRNKLTSLPRGRGNLSATSVAFDSVLLCDDALTDPRVDRLVCRRIGARSIVCVPLKRIGTPVGVVIATSRAPRVFSLDDVSTLAGLTTFVTAAITAIADAGPADVEGAGLSQASAPDVVLSTYIATVQRPGVIADVAAARRVREVIDRRQLRIVHQPIVELDTRQAIMVEALTRVGDDLVGSQVSLFADAWRVGMGPELESVALWSALATAARIPDACDLCVNMSVGALDHRGVVELIGDFGHRMVVELTEHHQLVDMDRLHGVLGEWRAAGVRLAVDDTGMGFSSLGRILELSPEIIKLDREIVRGIDGDRVRQSLADALLRFATDIGALVVAEGVETQAELETVYRLGCRVGQGFLLGAPAEPPRW